MSDLISRKTLMDIFQEKADDNTGLLRNNMLFAKELVKSVPTAYDVDKAVKELKGMSGIQFDGRNESYELNWCISTDRAVEIVKGAAKE